MDPRQLPSRSQGHVRQYLASAGVPAEPRNAATTILLRAGARQGPGEVEIFLLRRHARMAFAASVAVFPGGGVDPRDVAEGHEIDWAGPSADEWAARLGTSVEIARAVLCAAVRETFEESGVLLAGPSASAVVSDTSGPEWERDRTRLEAHEISLSELLRDRGLVLRTDLLRLWSVWLTPEFEPKRYRTWFFVAELPAGQLTRDVSTESEGALWSTVGDALRAADGATPMLPPQYCTTAALYEYGTPADVLAAAASRDPAIIMPTAEVDGETVRLALPDDVVELSTAVGARL